MSDTPERLSADDVPHDWSLCHDGSDHPTPVYDVLVGWGCPVCGASLKLGQWGYPVVLQAPRNEKGMMQGIYPHLGPGTVELRNDGDVRSS